MAARRNIDDNALVDAALKEFSMRGYEDASLNTIIDKANISKGSFYYRFKTKYELYLHLLKTGIEKKWEYINKRQPDSHSGLNTDIFDDFLLQAKVGAQFAAEFPDYYLLSVMFSREKGTPVYADAIRDLGMEDSSGLNDRIIKAIADGEIREDFPEDFVNRYIGHLMSTFDEMLFQDRDWNLETALEELEYLVGAIRNGLAPRADK